MVVPWLRSLRSSPCRPLLHILPSVCRPQESRRAWALPLRPSMPSGRKGRVGPSRLPLEPSRVSLQVFLSFPQRSLYHHRPLLGHQLRPAWLLHSVLAPEPRQRGQRGQWGEPRLGHHDAHRLPAEVSPPRPWAEALPTQEGCQEVGAGPGKPCIQGQAGRCFLPRA